MNARRAAAEIGIVAAVLVFGWSVGVFTSRHFAGQPMFYQADFGPAVMVAAGRGFVNPVIVPGSPLAEFLAVRRPSLSAADVNMAAEFPLDQFQQASRYLMLFVGYVWRFSGISWAAVSTVSGGLFGLMLAACYAVARVWFPRTLSVLGAVVLALSPAHLAQAPHIRDYSKAPFIVLACAPLALLALRPLSRRAVVLLSIACGVVAGLGVGFKMDVVIMAPIFVATVWLFRGERPWRAPVEKLLATAAFALAFVVAAAPVLFRVSSGGSNGYHVIVLGYADPFDAGLGLTRPAYSVLPFYDDGYFKTVVQEYGARSTGVVPELPSAAYDAAGRSYWLEIARHFPADVLVRAYASAKAILNSPFDSPALNFLNPPDRRTNPLWVVLTNQLPHRARVGAVFERLTIFNGWGWVLGVALVAAGAARSARLAVFAAWMTLALTGYASLQFAERHFFHLQFIPLMAVLAVAHALIRRRHDWAAIRRAAVAIVVLAVALVAPLEGVRAYQAAHLRGLFQEYIDAPRTNTGARVTDTGAGTVLVRWPGMEGRAPRRDARRTDYYVVEYDGSPQEAALAEVRYRSASQATDYSRMTAIPNGAGLNRLMIPVYGEAPAYTFDGLEMPARFRDNVRGVYRIEQPQRLPLLLDLRLGASWQEGRLYQTLTSAEAPGVRLLGAGGGATRLAWMARLGAPELTPRVDAVATSYTPAARVTAGVVEMDGPADTQSSYLLEFTPVTVDRPAALLVRGHLISGGVAVGALEDGRWAGAVVITDPGEFIAIVPLNSPPRAGRRSYTPIVTNATRRDRDRNRFTLSRFGVVTAGDVSR